MTKANRGWMCWPIVFSFILISSTLGCGPDTIFVRPGLDTPSQHVTNGYILLQQKKLNDAIREFERAKELDPYFTEAYVGLGLVYGYQGDIEYGLRTLDQAREMISNYEEQIKVDQGYDQLHQMMQEKGITPRQR